MYLNVRRCTFLTTAVVVSLMPVYLLNTKIFYEAFTSEKRNIFNAVQVSKTLNATDTLASETHNIIDAVASETLNTTNALASESRNITNALSHESPNVTKNSEHPTDEVLQFFSQYGQDKYMYTEFFKDISNGTFIEMGAWDGLAFSNTRFFESQMNWAGICVEPSKNEFDMLVTNRPKCANLNVAIGSENRKGTFIRCSEESMLSGIKEFMHPGHLRRISKYENIEVEIDIITIARALELAGFGSTINYFSLDVEGGECAVLKAINFEEIYFDVLSVENDYDDRCPRDTLEKHGYVHYTRLVGDDVFVRNSFLELSKNT